MEEILSGEGIGKYLGIMMGIQVVLYGVATGLTKIAVLTETNTDNKVAAVLSQVAWFTGSLLGKFGYSIPKPVLEEKAKQLNEQSKKTD